MQQLRFSVSSEIELITNGSEHYVSTDTSKFLQVRMPLIILLTVSFDEFLTMIMSIIV